MLGRVLDVAARRQNTVRRLTAEAEFRLSAVSVATAEPSQIQRAVRRSNGTALQVDCWKTVFFFQLHASRLFGRGDEDRSLGQVMQGCAHDYLPLKPQNNFAL